MQHPLCWPGVQTLFTGCKWKVVDLATPSNAFPAFPNFKCSATFKFSEKVVFNISEKFLLNSIKESWFTVKRFFMIGYSSANSGFIAAIITMPA